MSKFTPGPWKVQRSHDREWAERYYAIWTDQGIRGDMPIASVDGDNAVWLKEGEDIANACLISAAPDLYEALVKVNNSAEWDYLESDIQEAVVSALAKADGK